LARTTSARRYISPGPTRRSGIRMDRGGSLPSPHPQRGTAGTVQPGQETGATDWWPTGCYRFTVEQGNSSEALEYQTGLNRPGCSESMLAPHRVTVHCFGAWLSSGSASPGPWRRLGRATVHKAQSLCLSRRRHKTIRAGVGDESLVVESVEPASHVPWILTYDASNYLDAGLPGWQGLITPDRYTTG